MDLVQQIQNEQEEWRSAIKDGKILPGYEISNFGRVRNKKGKILKIQNQIPPENSMYKKGARQFIVLSIPKNIFEDYQHKSTSENTCKLCVSIHRLVIETFQPIDETPPIPKNDWDSTPETAKKLIRDSCVVDHIDDNPLNNNIKNLRWVSSKDNQTYRKKFELSKINKEEVC